jgi:cell fate (sporulation/competence/biofilm development) regulator YlbF (YheA/YmcA/DUF963 family)
MNNPSLNQQTSLLQALKDSEEFQEYDYTTERIGEMTIKQYKYFLFCWYSKKIQEAKRLLEQFIKLKPEADAQRKLLMERK